LLNSLTFGGLTKFRAGYRPEANAFGRMSGRFTS
jgi:hypothetical protein